MQTLTERLKPSVLFINELLGASIRLLWRRDPIQHAPDDTLDRSPITPYRQ
jgi:hypothetical protein